MRLLLLFLLVANLFLLSSCKKYQAADSSFFIKAGDISVATNSIEGSGSHKITDLLLYVNGKYTGSYPVGSLMPVVSKGEPVRLNVFAGIKNNGIADTRIFYPFYDILVIDTAVEAGKTITRPFTFKYRPATTFTWTENFDSGSGYSIKNGDTDSIFTIAAPADCFEGKSLQLALGYDGDYNQRARIESSGAGYSLTIGSSNVYLELNYKCNTPFTVGLIGSDGIDRPAIVVNEQPTWNKIYIQLSTAVSATPSNPYRVYFQFFQPQGETVTKQVFLDNIKLIYL